MEKILNNRKFLISLFVITAIVIVVAMVSIVANNNGKKNQEISNKTNNNLIEFNVEKRATEAEFKDRDSNHEIVINEVEENVVAETTTTELKSDSKYYIKVNNSANVVTIYERDGEILKPLKAMLCSTGRATPSSGQYKIQSRRTKWRALFGNVYGQYATNIVGNILFHSVPYTSQNPGTLEYEEYDKLGTSASMGCVRLKVEDAKWIYDNIPAGTICEFYSDSNPGPLGKPGLTKISGNERCRNYDPTDTEASGNPWFTNEEPSSVTIENIPNNINNNETNEQEIENLIVNITTSNVVVNSTETNTTNTITNETTNTVTNTIENNNINNNVEP